MSRTETSPAGIAASLLNGAAIDSTGRSASAPVSSAFTASGLDVVDEVERGGVLVARRRGRHGLGGRADDTVDVRDHLLLVVREHLHDLRVLGHGVRVQHLASRPTDRPVAPREREVDVEHREPLAPLQRLGEHDRLAGRRVGDHPLRRSPVRVPDEDRVDPGHLLRRRASRRSPGTAARRRTRRTCRPPSARRRRRRRHPCASSRARTGPPARPVRRSASCPRRWPCPRSRSRGWSGRGCRR